MLKLFDRANSPEEFEAIEEVFVKAAESYSRQYKFDSIEMGLIFLADIVLNTLLTLHHPCVYNMCVHTKRGVEYGCYEDI